MSRPMASQTMKRRMVTSGRLTIRTSEAIIERIGIQGTSGTRKARRRFGCVRRRMSTASETSTKAASVPILVSSATTSMGVSPATSATTTPMSRLDQYGVRSRGWMREKIPGSRPSRDMEKKMRLCPYSSTINTVVNPQMAPIEMILAAMFRPIRIMACETGEATLSCVYGTIPVSTAVENIQQRADKQAAYDANGQIFRRVARLLRRGRNHIEADIGKEDDAGATQDAARAERQKRRPVCRVDMPDAHDEEKQDDQQFDRHDDVIDRTAFRGTENQQAGNNQNNERCR